MGCLSPERVITGGGFLQEVWFLKGVFVVSSVVYGNLIHKKRAIAPASGDSRWNASRHNRGNEATMDTTTYHQWSIYRS